MKRFAEFTIFVAASAGLHVAAFAIAPAEEGINAAGEGGEVVISLTASSASLADMVVDWERPPEILTAFEPPPALPPSPVEPPQIEAPLATEASVAMARPDAPGLALPQAEEAPEIDTTAPPPQAEPPIEAEAEEPEAEPQETDLDSTAAVETSARPLARPRDFASVERSEAAPVQRSQAQASPSQRAAGQWDGAAAGNDRPADTSTLSQNQRQSLTARWGGQVRAAIERRKRYPRDATGASGTVVVRITVGRDGSLRNVALARSSGSAALDQAALRAVHTARSFPSAPSGLTEPTYTFTLPMTFSS
ncbi:energy transducer TonB [Halovulum dunhuangense]|uniref:Energy transducer TonB n=1 Tax=Halovulum dunhuangense TaxID=1505036 RepID=A0A849L7X6_9RHOB|nr:energy transducer TonB [Halovulum dunhuangense]NNU82147.1 energy transducer TonB [Halovulum dunhuangense]